MLHVLHGMSLEVTDDKSRVKTKLRSTFLNRAADLFKAKGCGEETAAEKARATELQLYRASKDRAEYKEKAVKVFANLKKQDGGEASPRGEPDEAPAAKKQKVEGDAAAVGGDGAGDGADEGAAAAAPKAEVAVVAKTGDPMRDKVRERISKALRLVPGRDRTAINKVRSAMQKGPLSEEEVAAAVEDEMHRVLTDTKAYKTQARNIFANIGAADNPTFRLRVLTGQIPATAVATLRPHDMASAEQQAKDSQIDKDAIYNGQVAQAAATEGIFQCGKCKSDIVRFVLAQVRVRFVRSTPTRPAAPELRMALTLLDSRGTDTVGRRADDSLLYMCDVRQPLEVLVVCYRSSVNGILGATHSFNIHCGSDLIYVHGRLGRPNHHIIRLLSGQFRRLGRRLHRRPPKDL